MLLNNVQKPKLKAMLAKANGNKLTILVRQLFIFLINSCFLFNTSFYVKYWFTVNYVKLAETL